MQSKNGIVFINDRSNLRLIQTFYTCGWIELQTTQGDRKRSSTEYVAELKTFVVFLIKKSNLKQLVMRVKSAYYKNTSCVQRFM